MDASKLVELGSRIVKISTELSGVRAERDAAQAKVLALETELMPLLVEHAQLIAGLAGSVSASVAPAAVSPPIPGGGDPVSPAAPVSLRQATPPAQNPMKNRVMDFLKRIPEGESISATEISDALKIDYGFVRECLLEMRNGRR